MNLLPIVHELRIRLRWVKDSPKPPQALPVCQALHPTLCDTAASLLWPRWMPFNGAALMKSFCYGKRWKHRRQGVLGSCRSAGSGGLGVVAANRMTVEYGYDVGEDRESSGRCNLQVALMTQIWWIHESRQSSHKSASQVVPANVVSSGCWAEEGKRSTSTGTRQSRDQEEFEMSDAGAQITLSGAVVSNCGATKTIASDMLYTTHKPPWYPPHLSRSAQSQDMNTPT